MLKLDKQDKQLLSLLITPSWVSGLIAVALGLIFSFGVILAFSVNNSAVQQQLIVWQQDEPTKELTKPGTLVSSEEHPQLKDSWPLLLVWASVGLLVYIITAAIVHSMSSAKAIRESMGYVHAKPLATLEITAGHVILRIIAAIALVIMVQIFIKQVIPYAITASHASASDLLSGTGILYTLLAFSIVAISVQLQAIFLRLTLGRARVFSGNV